jgi:hypothetical protein
VIFEAGFVARDTMIFADILVRGDDGFTLIEVKQGTSVTEEHIADLGVQAVVMREAGVKINRFELMHLNRECKFPDLGNLFVREDVTKQVVEMIPELDMALDHLLPIAKGSALPGAELGARCTRPRECAFIARCWPAVDADHIRYLYRLNKDKAIRFEKDGVSRSRIFPTSFSSAPFRRASGAVCAKETFSSRRGR